MKTSVCMIVKNEEPVIERCLNSVYGKVDEIIIVDTGSTDNTMAIIKEKFPKVKTYFYKWNNDFSAARNFGIKKATSEWIMYMDADEEYVGEMPKEQIPPGIYNFVIKNKTDDGQFVDSVCGRFFANVKGVQFINRVHEIIASPKVPLLIYNYTFGHIIHHGYTTDEKARKGKVERNMEMISLEYKDNPSPPNCFYYGQETIISGDFAKARDIALEGIGKITKENKLDSTFLPLLHHLYIEAVASMNDFDAVEHYEVEMYPKCENPESLVSLMNFYYRHKNEYKLLIYALDLAKWQNAPELPIKFVENNIRVAPWIALAKFYYAAGDKLKSLMFFELAYMNGQKDIMTLKIIHELLPKSKRNAGKWEALNKEIYSKTQDIRYLKEMVDVYFNTGEEDKIVKATEMANDMLNEEERFILFHSLKNSGRMDVAERLTTTKKDMKILAINNIKPGTLSIIIPTMYLANLEYFLYNLQVFEDIASVKEVIVINNSGNPSPDFMSQFSKVRIIDEEINIGVNPAWNKGITLATGEYYLLLNDDCLSRTSVISTLCAILDTDEKVGVLVCRTAKIPLDDYSKLISPDNISYIEYEYFRYFNSNGWFIGGRVADYPVIPDVLKIFYGDDYIHYAAMKLGKKVVKLMSDVVSHDISSTVQKLDIYNTDTLLVEGNAFKDYLKEKYNDEFIDEYLNQFLAMVKFDNDQKKTKNKMEV